MSYPDAGGSSTAVASSKTSRNPTTFLASWRRRLQNLGESQKERSYRKQNRETQTTYLVEKEDWGHWYQIWLRVSQRSKVSTWSVLGGLFLNMRPRRSTDA
jgi:hypothetical protein